MTVIAPTILAENEDKYRQAVEVIHPFAQRVQIDMSDGEFAPNFTVGEDKVWWPQEWTVDIHSMVARPAEHLQALISLKPSLIIFHVETGVNLVPIIQTIKSSGIRAGVALLRPTVPATVRAAIEAADHALVFSGDLGHYGGTANLMQLEKIRLIKDINSEIEIGWDGGANIDNVFTLAQGGVDVINVGGAIMNAPDPAAAYNQLVKESQKRGVIF